MHECTDTRTNACMHAHMQHTHACNTHTHMDVAELLRLEVKVAEFELPHHPEPCHVCMRASEIASEHACMRESVSEAEELRQRN